MREFGEEKTGWKGEETTPSFVITVPAVSFFMRFSEREREELVRECGKIELLWVLRARGCETSGRGMKFHQR